MLPAIDPQPIGLFVTFGVMVVVGFLLLFGATIGICALLGMLYGPKAPLPDSKIDVMLQKMNGESRWGKK
jgi:hypothetical protein